MTPLQRAIEAVEDALVGHVDPTSHTMSEYGIAKMILPIVLTAIREPSEAMVKAGWDSECIIPSQSPEGAWTAMIDAMLEEG